MKRIFLGTSALVIACFLNLKYAVNDYGVIDNEQHACVLAQSNSSGGGTTGGGTSGGGTTGGGTTGGGTTGGGTSGGGTSCGQCPDPYDVPNHFIQVVSTSNLVVTSNSKGEITVIIGGTTTIKGGYAKNSSISVIVSVFNCSGEALGACCKQSDVRVEIS